MIWLCMFVHFFTVMGIAERAQCGKRHAWCVCFSRLSQNWMEDVLGSKTTWISALC